MSLHFFFWSIKTTSSNESCQKALLNIVLVLTEYGAYTPSWEKTEPGWRYAIIWNVRKSPLKLGRNTRTWRSPERYLEQPAGYMPWMRVTVCASALSYLFYSPCCGLGWSWWWVLWRIAPFSLVYCCHLHAVCGRREAITRQRCLSELCKSFPW